MRLELDRSLVLERGVFAVSVVVAVDVIEEFGAGIGGVLEDAALEHFELEGADEGLRPGVIVRIGASRHALAQPGRRQGQSKRSAAVLAAAVAMEDGAAHWTRLQSPVSY